MDAGVELAEKESVAATAFNFPASDANASVCGSNAKLPRRLRRRLLESKGSPTTAEEIEAKLKEADIRRQQYYEILSSKARTKQKGPSSSSLLEEDLGERLKAKLNAAEQNRLSILAKIQKRLARLDKMRQAAKMRVEMRLAKERDELGMKVESRVRQAEANRMLLLRARRQRRTAKKEQTAQSLMRRLNQESRYKECVWDAIRRKHAAAEKKRLALLETEKSRAHARVLQVRRVATSLSRRREIDRRRLKDQLDDRLQRATMIRAEHLRKNGSLHGSSHASSKRVIEQGELLSRKLARCWRRFVRLKGTTLALARAYAALEINEISVKLMPFEKLALHIESPTTIKVVKALLGRFESHISLMKEATDASNTPSLKNIEHLLKIVASFSRRNSASNPIKNRAAKLAGPRKEVTSRPSKLSRYPVRVVLSSYMILGHPYVVFSEKGEPELALAESVKSFVRELELLIKIILDGPIQITSDASPASTSTLTFRTQLEVFDRAWCSYLHRFVMWKVKDAKLLIEELARAAGNQEMHIIEKQVAEYQKFSGEEIQPVRGNIGLEPSEHEPCDTKSRLDNAKENRELLAFPAANTSLVSPPDTDRSSNSSDGGNSLAEVKDRSSYTPCTLFKDTGSSPSNDVVSSTSQSSIESHLSSNVKSFSENELLVNEIVHDHRHGFADILDISNPDQNSIKAKVRETMEKAFWDGVMESMKQDEPDYSWVLKLMKEVRDELCEMSPLNWRQEIVGAIDIDILSQVLKSGSLDIDYLGKILEFCLLTLHKLSAQGNEDQMETTHQKLLQELGEVSEAGDKSNAAVALLIMKGLRFILRKIQTIKHDISKARIRILEPLIKGPAGFEYLQKAFTNSYGPPADAPASLPLTKQWLSSVLVDSEQDWDAHTDSLSALTASDSRCAQGLPHNTLRTGGNVMVASETSAPSVFSSGSEKPDCKGEKIDLLLRLGLLKLAREVEGLTSENLPETLKLNLSRLRNVQSQLQKIIVISTSILVLRQTLLGEKLVTSPTDMENIVSQCIRKLSELLDNVEDAGISEIIEVLSGFTHSSDPQKVQTCKEVMANMLLKSLQAGDAIFNRVSQAVYLAARGIVLGGSGAKGRQLAETALKRVGASLLTENLVGAIEVLIVVAMVSGRVHRPWYEEILKKL